MNEAVRWRKGKEEERDNLIGRLKTIYKEIGKQIKHSRVRCLKIYGNRKASLFALAGAIIYIRFLTGEIFGNLLRFRVSDVTYWSGFCQTFVSRSRKLVLVERNLFDLNGLRQC